jgi:phage FluMu protein Com|tara:strand:- start:1022 stop:1255 length:234 start_codon:yes stop_codon:yes gene_type:complete
MSQCKHKWVVFSTAINDGYVIVQCGECKTIGAIENPTKEEWGDAYYAPDFPYRWFDDERVTKHKSCSFQYVEIVEAQ